MRRLRRPSRAFRRDACAGARMMRRRDVISLLGGAAAANSEAKYCERPPTEASTLLSDLSGELCEYDPNSFDFRHHQPSLKSLSKRGSGLGNKTKVVHLFNYGCSPNV